MQEESWPRIVHNQRTCYPHGDSIVVNDHERHDSGDTRADHLDGDKCVVKPYGCAKLGVRVL